MTSPTASAGAHDQASHTPSIPVNTVDCSCCAAASRTAYSVPMMSPPESPCGPLAVCAAGGPSGSEKRSLVFDTIAAKSQRPINETDPRLRADAGAARESTLDECQAETTMRSQTNPTALSKDLFSTSR